MHRIEPIVGDFTLPDGAVCLTPTGWRYDTTYELTIEIQANSGGPRHAPASLDQIFNAVWVQYGSLLGVGDLVFKQTSLDPIKGYILFVPTA